MARPSNVNVKRAHVAVALEDQGLVNKLNCRCTIGRGAIAGWVAQDELRVLPLPVAGVNIQGRRWVGAEPSAGSGRDLGRVGIRREFFLTGDGKLWVLL